MSKFMSRTVALIAVVTVLAIIPALAADAEAGHAIYTRKCKTCHGAEGEGNPGMAKVLKTEIRALGSPEVQAASDADLAKIVKEGKGKMKPASGVTDADIENVVAFVRTLKK